MKHSETPYDFSVLRRIRKSEGLTIEALAGRTGLSSAVISRIERNQSSPELDTLFRLGKAFGVTATELIGLVEKQTCHCVKEEQYETDGFVFRKVEYGNVRCLLGESSAGGVASRPDVHKDDYEVCWVLRGRVVIELPNETHDLSVGDAVQFDAMLRHSYRALEDCQVVLVHIKKGKRF